VNLRVVELERSAFHEFREQTLQKLGLPKDHHKTCPLTYLEDDQHVPIQFLGGFDALKAAKL
jgi:hypothetical protein